MKAKTASPETAVLTAERKLHNTWVYIKRHWQLYLLFLLPAVALTLVFKYAPMGGVLIAFQKYNPFKGIWGSEWVGFKNFTRFMSSPDFQRYLINTHGSVLEHQRPAQGPRNGNWDGSLPFRSHSRA